jgi:hypothetical protein
MFLLSVSRRPTPISKSTTLKIETAETATHAAVGCLPDKQLSIPTPANLSKEECESVQ